MISWICVFILSSLALLGVIPDSGYSKDTLLILVAISAIGVGLFRRADKKM